MTYYQLALRQGKGFNAKVVKASPSYQDWRDVYNEFFSIPLNRRSNIFVMILDKQNKSLQQAYNNGSYFKISKKDRGIKS